jgi:hypothetical protein
VQAIAKPDEDPFASAYPQATPTKDAPKASDKNESFEEIKVNTTTGSAAYDTNKSVEK